jgi:glucose-6-phosphate isomerase
VVPDVHEILERIKNFSNKIRSGELKGFTGKNITDVLVIGIGGSYLSIEFVHESLRNNK